MPFSQQGKRRIEDIKQTPKIFMGYLQNQEISVTVISLWTRLEISNSELVEEASAVAH